MNKFDRLDKRLDRQFIAVGLFAGCAVGITLLVVPHESSRSKCYEDQAIVGKSCIDLTDVYGTTNPPSFTASGTTALPCKTDEIGVVVIDRNPKHGLTWRCTVVGAK